MPAKPCHETEVLVVGGGPAGLAAAIASRLAGFEVVLLDRARPLIDKACGEGLMPDGVARLQDLGVMIDPRRRRAFNGIRYIDGEVVAEGRFPRLCGYGIRRLDLHDALLRRAEALGVALNWQAGVAELLADGVETPTARYQARFILAADGLRSRLRRAAGLEKSPASWARFGVRRHFKLAPWTELVEVHWAAGCEAYVTPVGVDEVGVAILWSGRKAGFDALLESFPALAERLRGAETSSGDRGAGPLRQQVRGVVSGRLALLGDAAGYVDAITGEGLSVAFHQATAVVQAMRQDDLRSYTRAHRAIMSLPDNMTHLLLAIERRPWLRRRVIQALAREPEIFSRLLAIHCRALPLRRLGFEPVRKLLWRLAWA